MAGPCSLGVHSCQESTPKVAWSSLDLSVNEIFPLLKMTDSPLNNKIF